MKKFINKKEFRDRVYKKAKDMNPYVTYENTYWILAAVFECMADILEKKETLCIYGYLTMYPNLLKEKRVGNFGNPCVIPEHYVPYFKPHVKLNKACESLMMDDQEKDMEDID